MLPAMKSKAIILVKAAVTIGLIAFLASRVDLKRFVEVFQSARMLPLVPALVGTFVSHLIGAWRWQIILAAFSLRVRYLKSLQLVLIGTFFNVFLPTLVGGDVLKSFYLGREKSQPFTLILTTTFLERCIGYFALLLIGTAASGLTGVRLFGFYLFPFFLAASAAFCLLFWTLLNPRLHDWTAGWLRRRGWTRAVERSDAIAAGLNQLRQAKRVLGMALVASLAIQVVSVSVTWSVARSLGADRPFELFLIFVPIISTVTMLPLSLGGFGLRETAFYVLFTQVGISREVSVSIGLLNYLVVVLVALPGGLVYSLYKRDEKFDAAMTEAENA